MSYVHVLICVVLAAHQIQSDRIDADGCGLRPLAPQSGRRLSTRIVGGTEASPYSWPSMCVLKEANGNVFFCGGSLIKSKQGDFFLLTAAHCVVPRTSSQPDPSSYEVWCSIHSLKGSDPYAVHVPATHILAHPAYKDGELTHDFALFTLQTPNVTDRLQPICLPTAPSHAYEMGHIMGWGLLTQNGVQSQVLMEGRKPVVPIQQCQDIYGGHFEEDNMFCAGHLGSGEVDTCSMDSGGPFVVYRNGTYEILGVVSWGYGCANPLYPGVYADVYKVLQWIASVINTRMFH